MFGQTSPVGALHCGSATFRSAWVGLDGNLCTVTSEGSLQQVVYDAEKVVLEKKKK